MTSATVATAGSGAPAPEPVSDRRGARVPLPLVLATLSGAVLSGMVVASLAGGSHPVVALLLPLAAVPVILWKRPQVGFFVVVGATAVIEQFAYTVGPRQGAVTGKIPFFHSLTPGSGVTPAEIVLAICIVSFVATRIRNREPILPRCVMSRCILAFLALTVLYLLVGFAHHGKFKIAIWELRPWFYLAAMYMLGAAFLSTKKAVRLLMWLYVLGCSAKAVYGLWIWLSVRHLNPRPQNVLAHEESFFFGLYLVITVGLWIFSIRGRLRVTATALSPIVFLADMANTRRVAWAILGAMAILLFAIAYVRVAHRRPVLRRIAAIVLVILAVYIPAYWNHDGTLAQPARALRSQIAPDARDKQSNQYRNIENLDLIVNIRASKDLGTGFGVPIDYAYTIVNLQSQDSAIAYIPHDGVLYVWMRMGLLGEIALWFMIGVGMVGACRLTRLDRETALLGTITACALVAYVIMGAEDMGFFWFRIALCIGALLGAVEAARRRSATAAESAVER